MPEESKLAEKLENATKFSEEELIQSQEIQTEYGNIQNHFGRIQIIKIRLDEQMINISKNKDDIQKQFIELQEKEREFLKEITKKYGEGSLNPETGEFTQNKSN